MALVRKAISVKAVAFCLMSAAVSLLDAAALFFLTAAAPRCSAATSALPQAMLQLKSEFSGAHILLSLTRTAQRSICYMVYDGLHYFHE